MLSWSLIAMVQFRVTSTLHFPPLAWWPPRYNVQRTYSVQLAPRPCEWQLMTQQPPILSV